VADPFYFGCFRFTCHSSDSPPYSSSTSSLLLFCPCSLLSITHSLSFGPGLFCFRVKWLRKRRLCWALEEYRESCSRTVLNEQTSGLRLRSRPCSTANCALFQALLPQIFASGRKNGIESDISTLHDQLTFSISRSSCTLPYFRPLSLLIFDR
jgi:hypothetical protein